RTGVDCPGRQGARPASAARYQLTDRQRAPPGWPTAGPAAGPAAVSSEHFKRCSRPSPSSESPSRTPLGRIPMIGSFTQAARLLQTDRDQAALIGDTEGQVAVALLRQIRGNDWQRPTDCPEWDVRALVSHLVAQCEDGLRLGTMLRRELAGRRRY